MAYESSAEPIKIGYLMDFRLPDGYPRTMREDLTNPFEFVFSEGLARSIHEAMPTDGQAQTGR